MTGCLADCSGVALGYTCNSTSSPSICSPICGDGLVIGIEKCDAGTKPGCLPNCTGP